jgi:hypothetical protein
MIRFAVLTTTRCFVVDCNDVNNNGMEGMSAVRSGTFPRIAGPTDAHMPLDDPGALGKHYWMFNPTAAETRVPRPASGVLFIVRSSSNVPVSLKYEGG